MICSQPRVLKGLFPVAEGCEMKLYECASCGSDLWLVTRASKSSSRMRERKDFLPVRGSGPATRP
jgi:hypothetical protein